MDDYPLDLPAREAVTVACMGVLQYGVRGDYSCANDVLCDITDAHGMHGMLALLRGLSMTAIDLGNLRPVLDKAAITHPDLLIDDLFTLPPLEDGQPQKLAGFDRQAICAALQFMTWCHLGEEASSLVDRFEAIFRDDAGVNAIQKLASGIVTVAVSIVLRLPQSVRDELDRAPINLDTLRQTLRRHPQGTGLT